MSHTYWGMVARGGFAYVEELHASDPIVHVARTERSHRSLCGQASLHRPGWLANHDGFLAPRGPLASCIACGQAMRRSGSATSRR